MSPLSNMLRHAGEKSDLTYVMRELDNGRPEKFKLFFPRIKEMSKEEVVQCKAAAHCRFGEVRGRLEEVNGLSEHIELMHPTLKHQEVANLNAMIESLQSNKEHILGG